MLSTLLAQFQTPDAAVHFIGCGGAGTAPLLRIFHELRFRVSGSDLIDNRETEALRDMGIPVFTGAHDAAHLPEAERLLVVHTSAAESSNPELQEAVRRNAVILRRGEALAEAAKLFPQVIAVSGSHGKTSVTAMLSFALRELGEDPGFLIGGTLPCFPASGTAGAGSIFITEADESDGTHTLIHSTIGIVTNMEDDHVWSLGGFHILQQNFRTFADQAETLVYCADVNTDALYRERQDGVIRIAEWDKNVFSEKEFSTRGDFHLKNEYTVLLALERMGYPRQKILAALEKFPGVDRRMTVHYDTPALRIMEDYAHHPTELRESIKAFRKTNPGRRLVIAFQPHRYARLERYFHEFAQELKAADRCYILPVFAAWTGKGRYTSDDLAEAAGAISLHGTFEEMAGTICADLRNNDLLCIIGAGDGKELIPHCLSLTKNKDL